MTRSNYRYRRWGKNLQIPKKNPQIFDHRTYLFIKPKKWSWISFKGDGQQLEDLGPHAGNLNFRITWMRLFHWARLGSGWTGPSWSVCTLPLESLCGTSVSAAADPLSLSGGPRGSLVLIYNSHCEGWGTLGLEVHHRASEKQQKAILHLMKVDPRGSIHTKTGTLNGALWNISVTEYWLSFVSQMLAHSSKSERKFHGFIVSKVTTIYKN